MEPELDHDLARDLPDSQNSGPQVQLNPRAKDPLICLYYSIVLTTLTVIVALIIGTLQFLSMIQNVANPPGKFWDGIAVAGDDYDIIGGGICGSFIIFGTLSVFFYKPWRRWIEGRRAIYQAQWDAVAATGADQEAGLSVARVQEQRQSLILDIDGGGPEEEQEQSELVSVEVLSSGGTAKKDRKG